ncbi:MAG: zinc ribbon domain-containing protein, partial [Sulfolobales archaeon]
MWTYRYLLRRIAEIGEEYGIEVEPVSEENASTFCPLCRVKNQDHRIVQRVTEVLHAQQGVQRRPSGSIQ